MDIVSIVQLPLYPQFTKECIMFDILFMRPGGDECDRSNSLYLFAN